MKSVRWLLIVALVVPVALASCGGGEEAASDKQYPITGTVIAVDSGKSTVTIDHEEIPGLMKAMEMEYAVEDATLLEGIKAGDQVEGRLNVESGKYVITQLQNR